MIQQASSRTQWLGSRLGETRIVAALILVTAVILRLPNLEESLWFDEVVYSTRFVATDLSTLWQLALTDTPAPLYRVFLYGWNRFFGENEIILRLPSVIFGIGVILLTYAIAKQYGSPKMQALAALFLCFSPVQVWYSQEATPYAMATCLLLAAVFVWQDLKSGACAGYWYLIYALVLWGALFTHYLTAVFLFPLSVMALNGVPTAQNRIIAINILLGALTIGALFAKSKLGFLALGQSFLRPFTLFEWWMLFFNWFLYGNSIWTLSPYKARLENLLNSQLMLTCQMFFLFILVRGLIRPGQGGPWRSLELLLFLGSLPLTLFLLTLVGYDRMYIERYVFMTMPFFALAVARGAAESSNAWLKRGCITATFVLGVISYAMFMSKGGAWTVYKQNPDMRSVASYLAAQKLSADEALFILPTGTADLAYYVNKQSSQGHPTVKNYDPTQLEHALGTGKLRAIFLINNRYWTGRFRVVYPRLNSDPRLKMVNIRSFKGVDIYTFVPK